MGAHSFLLDLPLSRRALMAQRQTSHKNCLHCANSGKHQSVLSVFTHLKWCDTTRQTRSYQSCPPCNKMAKNLPPISSFHDTLCSYRSWLRRWSSPPQLFSFFTVSRLYNGQLTLSATLTKTCFANSVVPDETAQNKFAFRFSFWMRPIFGKKNGSDHIQI